MKQKSKLKLFATAIAVAVMTSACVGAVYSVPVSEIDSVVFNNTVLQVASSEIPNVTVKYSLPACTLTF
jgi:uncharacterized membrane protein